MNYIKHLTGFYDRISQDNRLNPTHISLYLALFQFWNLNHFQNPISISRSEMMRLSKIAALGTYHKCIKQLQEFGYIVYEPSFNPYKGSLVHLYNFDETTVQQTNRKRIKKQTSSEQVVNSHHIKIDTGIEQALIPSINNTNILNNKHGISTKKNIEEFDFKENVIVRNEATLNYDSDIVEAPEKEKLRKKKSVILSAEQSGAVEESFKQKFRPPQLAEIQLYFAEKEAPSEEAEKFYNHYESNGWLVGGKTKMKNWQAAARNWLLNSKKFNPFIASTAKQSHLTATTNKSYQDKL
ncbi:transcriptional regulator [Epilithonimonas hominis]|uniref:transcriptional regulator n=1 Tax=Epilithonimonas hominis TaxID=420404 RepID=UPI002899205F|nr:transcriptional regulator [Epilithonimonas hominis]